MIAYPRAEIFGRHVVDTLFLTHAYDVSHRSLDGYGLKEVAAHFGLAAADRVYLDGALRYDRSTPPAQPESDFLLGQPAGGAL